MVGIFNDDFGGAITALSTVLPVAGTALGLDIRPEIIVQAGEQAVSALQALGGIIGTVMTIYGRARANKPLSANGSFNLKL